jgi:hypothetical protein
MIKFLKPSTAHTAHTGHYLFQTTQFDAEFYLVLACFIHYKAQNSVRTSYQVSKPQVQN